MKTISGSDHLRMARKIVILFIISVVFIGCKPKQIIIEKVITKVDSIAITSMKNELQKKVIEIEFLKTDIERSRDEISRLTSESSSHTINYDTTGPVNPETGKYPILQEIITNTKSQLDRMTKEMESLKQEHAKEVDSFITANTDLKIRVDKLTIENSELNKKITPTTGFNFKLFFCGIISGAGICLIIFFRKKLHNILSFFRLF